MVETCPGPKNLNFTIEPGFGLVAICGHVELFFKIDNDWRPQYHTHLLKTKSSFVPIWPAFKRRFDLIATVIIHIPETTDSRFSELGFS